MAQAFANGLQPIYCVGENLEEREAGRHFEVVKTQIEEVIYNLTPAQFARTVIAYEPVWAIGTGKTATAEQAQEIHAYIRTILREKFGAAADETLSSTEVPASRRTPRNSSPKRTWTAA